MTWTPKELAENFADDLLERGVINRFDWLDVADAMATAITEDRVGMPRDEEDTLP